MEPNEWTLSAPLNQFDQARLEQIRIGDKGESGRYSPTVYYTLINSQTGEESRNHAVSLEGLFATNPDPRMSEVIGLIDAAI